MFTGFSGGPVRLVAWNRGAREKIAVTLPALSETGLSIEPT